LKVALTHNAMIRGLTLPEGAVEEKFWDHGHEDALPGFGLRLRASGGRTWIYQFKLGDKHNRLKIGSWPLLTLEKARTAAAEMRRKIEAGGNPAAERADTRKRASHTFGSFVDKYLLWRQRQKRPLKPRTFVEIKRHLKTNAKLLHPKLLSTIDRRTIAAELAEIEETRGPVARNRVRASWSTFFTWLLKEGHLGENGQNPVAYTNKAAEIDRDRVLTDDEIREIWTALPEHGDDYGDIVRLLLMTGQRRDEIASLAWDEIDFNGAVITLPGLRTKNRREHLVPMPEPVISILKARKRLLGRKCVFGIGASGRGFQNWSASKEEVDHRVLESRKAALGKQAKAMPEWHLHDLRRTMDTAMNDRLGIAPHVVEAILNHISSHKSGKSGVSGVYNKALYLRERTEALNKWADYVTTIVAGKHPDIVMLKATARG
jgi:integrase